MGQTNIAWTDYTYNPWRGCTQVSAGCAHCYAKTDRAVVIRGIEWGAGKPRVRKAVSTQFLPLQWDRAAARRGERIKVFCASLGDVFDDDPSQLGNLDQWRKELFQLIAKTTHTDWQLLTKRPHVAERYSGEIQRLPQIWLGVSCEDQETAEERLTILARIPAAVRFASAEPLLAPVSFAPWLRNLDWVIVGGESGPHARPMNLDWARMIRDECTASGCKFFFKQVGGRDREKGGKLLDGQIVREFPRPKVTTVKSTPVSAVCAAMEADSQNCCGNRIKAARIELEIDQAELGRRLGLRRDAITKIEIGARCVSDKELLGFSKALHTAPDILLGMGGSEAAIVRMEGPLDKEGSAARGLDGKNVCGRLVEARRLGMPLSQTRLGEMVDMGRSAIAMLESRKRCVTDMKLAALAQALGTTPNKLLGVESPDPTPIEIKNDAIHAWRHEKLHSERTAKGDL